MYNGSLEQILNWQGSIAQLRDRLGWADKTVITYAGVIGLGQDFMAVLPQIAEIHNDHILFAFIGDGPQKADFARVVVQKGLKNIQFYDSMPQSEVIQYLYASDILLVVLREVSFFHSAIPSKFFDSMAVGKPVIANVDGELRKIMEDNQTGLYFSASVPNSFSTAVGELVKNPELRPKMGQNGKSLVADRFLRSKIADEAIKTLENLA
jgi:glycosyltransferase involved in cell wall biosynthesis